MVTLHAYVLRELLKTFGLTLTALTVLFTLGGGLFNIVRLEAITTADVVSFLPYLVPPVITVVMPIAALFAATIVYGRFAADNEFVACRAAGINVHRLFLSVMLLSVFVAAFTLLFGSFVIPGFVQRIEEFARLNVRDIVFQQLQTRGYAHLGKKGQERFTVTAERVQDVPDALLQTSGFEVADGLRYLLITQPTMLQIDGNGDLSRYIVARDALCVFDTRGGELAVKLHVSEGQDYEIGRRSVAIEQQEIGPVRVRLPKGTRMATAYLTDLLAWRKNPAECPRITPQLQRFADDVLEVEFLARLLAELPAGREVHLADRSADYRIRAAEARRQSAQPKRLVLGQPRIEVHPRDGRPVETYTPAQAELECRALPPNRAALTPDETLSGATIDPAGYRLLAALKLLESADREPAAGPAARLKTATLLDLELRPEQAVPAGVWSPARVLDARAPLPVPELEERRTSLLTTAAALVRKLTALINFRLGITASVLVTLLMGAMLGIMFRGSRILGAILLSLVPFFSVLILLVLAKQFTEDAQMTHIGPLLTWASLGLILLADGVILRVGVRR
ncbi:MAG: LptF/LptG family permease [Planctomycetota bacterium]